MSCNILVKPVTVKSINKKIIRQMKELGTYRKEFDMIIDIFSGMLFQYQKLAQDYAEMGYPVTDVYVNKAGAENERKVPILTAMEILRKDILSYSNQLMLNPKSLGEVIEQDSGSPLVEVLKFKNNIKKKRVSPNG